MAIKWSDWASLGKPQETEIGRPFARSNQDGRLEAFLVGQDGQVWHIWQMR